MRSDLERPFWVASAVEHQGGRPKDSEDSRTGGQGESGRDRYGHFRRRWSYVLAGASHRQRHIHSSKQDKTVQMNPMGEELMNCTGRQVHNREIVRLRFFVIAILVASAVAPVA